MEESDLHKVLEMFILQAGRQARLTSVEPVLHKSHRPARHGESRKSFSILHSLSTGFTFASEHLKLESDRFSTFISTLVLLVVLSRRRWMRGKYVRYIQNRDTYHSPNDLTP